MSYFKSMFEKPQVSRPNMVVYLFNCIDRLDRAVQRALFRGGGVNFIKDGGDKVPRSDGFSIAFKQFSGLQWEGEYAAHSKCSI